VRSWSSPERAFIAWGRDSGPSFSGLIPNPNGAEGIEGWGRSSGGLTRVDEVPDAEMPTGTTSALCLPAYSSIADGRSGSFESDIQFLVLDEVSYLHWQMQLSPGETGGGTGLWVVGVQFFGGGSAIPDPDWNVSWSTYSTWVREVDVEDGWTFIENVDYTKVPDGADGVSLFAYVTTHAGDEGRSIHTSLVERRQTVIGIMITTSSAERVPTDRLPSLVRLWQKVT